MNPRKLALKVTLNSYCVIIAAFTIIQAVNYSRDSYLLDTGSMGEFASSFAMYMGTRVLPVLTVLAAFIYLRALRFTKPLARVAAGHELSAAELEAARKRLASFKGFVLALNLLGFTLGYLVDLVLLDKIGSMLTMDTLPQLTFNLAGAGLYATAQNAVNNLILAGPRELLRVERLPKDSRERGVRARAVVLTLYVSVYSMTFMYNNYEAIHEQEVLYSDALEAGVSQNLSVSEIEDIYKQRASRMLAQKSSRLQLPPERISFPMDAGSGVERFEKFRRSFLIIFFTVLAIVLSVQYTTSTHTRNQIRTLIDKMRDILQGAGDLTKRIHLTGLDEIGELGANINALVEHLNGMLLHVAEATRTITQSQSSITESVDRATAAAEQLSETTNAVRDTAERQVSEAERAQGNFTALHDSIKSINSSVDTQATFVDETSSSVAEMASNIQSVNTTSANANQMTNRLQETADEGARSVSDGAKSIHEIEETAKRVSGIMALISDMNEQTNLLAMNAAIEAAHAGKQGQGFAVVATEVRQLAEDGAGQAKQIVAQIDEMNDRIRNGVELSTHSGRALEQISEDVQAASQLIQEISAAMSEQAAGADQIVKAVESVVDSTHRIRQSVVDQSAESERIEEVIRRLVAAAKDISTAAESQSEENRRLAEAIGTVAASAQHNSESVSSLADIVSRFKLDTRSTT